MRCEHSDPLQVAVTELAPAQRMKIRSFTATELARVTCPIGVPGIAEKRPEVTAVAAQVLQDSD